MKSNLKLVLLLVIGCFFSGCAGIKNTMRPSEKISGWNPIKRESVDKKETDESAEPESMAVIWKDSTLEKPGVPSVKGFGGRIYFYDADNQAVKADGELVVYGFDDSQKTNEEKSQQADRKFVFKAEQFQSHFSETDLGPSYSVWIPWEKVGGFRKTIVLIPIFKTSNGQALKSGQSIVVLPGKNPHRSDIAKNSSGSNSSGSIQQVSYEADAKGHNPKGSANKIPVGDHKSAVRTSTINVPPSVATRLSLPNSTVANRGHTNQAGPPSAGGHGDSMNKTPTLKSNQSATTGVTTDQHNSTMRSRHQNRPSTESTGSTRRPVFGVPGSF